MKTFTSNHAKDLILLVCRSQILEI